MLLSPWDYWSDGGRTPKEHTPEALRLLEGALAKSPDHIAAIHFYIHLVEASDRPERAEAYADRLRGASPARATSCTYRRTSTRGAADTRTRWTIPACRVRIRRWTIPTMFIFT